MKHLQTLEEIEQVSTNTLIKFGQPGCVPCELVGNNLEELENEFSKFKFFSCDDIDIIVSLGIQHTPFIKLKTENGDETLSDIDIMLDIDSLKEWLSKF